MAKNKTNKSNRVERRVKKDKKEFLAIFREHLATVTISCKMMKMNRSTFYDWLKNDKAFEKKVEEIRKEQNLIVEDILKKTIIMKEYFPAVRFFLESNHPNYKPKKEVELTNPEGRVFKMEITTKENDKNKMGTDTKTK